MKLSLKEIKKKIHKFTSKISFDWLFDKRVLVVLSVVIAIVFWFYITLNVSPTEEKTFSDVPVTIDPVAIDSKGLVLLDIMDTSILGDKSYSIPVTVEGDRYSLTQLKKDDISVVAQLTNVIEDQPNNYTLALKVTCNNNLYDVTTKTNVESITVKLDVVSSKTYSIKTKSNSTVTAEFENYTMDSPGTYVGNEKITKVDLTGPQSVISRVNSIEIFAEGAKNLTQTTDFSDGRFILLDETGVEISGSDLNYVTVTAKEGQYENVAISDAKITVRVPIRVIEEAKISVGFDESEVGSKFDFSKLERHMVIKPASNVSIKYPPDIDKSDAASVINTNELKIGKINLSSITPKNNVYKDKITLPPNVEFTGEIAGDTLEVEVEFDLTSYTMSDILTVEIDEDNFIYDKIQNKDGVELEIIPPSTMTIVLVGPRSEISRINKENISEKVSIVADVSTVNAAGAKSVLVNVFLNGKTGCWVIEDNSNSNLSLYVNIVEKTGE